MTRTNQEILKVYGGKKPVRFFLDMDGVLVDFNKEFQKHLPGHTEETDWTWQELHALCPDIYKDAPAMEDLYVMLGYIQQYSDVWHILTAIPKRWNWPNVTKHKRHWANLYLPEISDDRILFGPYAEDKQFHCTGPFDVLIDDKIRNIEQWRAKGGTGIRHVSAEDTIGQLKEHGF